MIAHTSQFALQYNMNSDNVYHQLRSIYINGIDIDLRHRYIGEISVQGTINGLLDIDNIDEGYSPACII